MYLRSIILFLSFNFQDSKLGKLPLTFKLYAVLNYHYANRNFQQYLKITVVFFYNLKLNIS